MRKLWKFAVVGAAGLALLVLGTQGSVPPAKASETSVTVYWNMNGPVSGNDETPQFIAGVAIPCFDCYLTSATPDLEVDSDPGAGETWIHASYTSVPPARLHHMVSFNHNRVDATCANSSPFNALGDRWLASGDERGTLSFPAGYGYYIPPSDGGGNNFWTAQIMVHNFSLNPQRFRVRMDFKYYPASDHLKDVTHLWLDVNNCSVSTYETPQGYFDYHWTWTDGAGPGTADDVEGTVLEIGGHVHDLGVSVAATKGTGPTSPVIGCPSVGGYATGSTWNPPTISSPDAPAAAHPADNTDLGAGDPGYQGHIESMTGCLTNATIAVGDAIQLHSQYNAIAGVCDGTPGDNPNVPPDGPGTSGCIDDVMGIMGAWVYDNCPNVSNPTQEDVIDSGYPPAAGDGYGDACDADKDGDGLCDTANVQGPGGYTCTGNDLDDDGDGFPDASESGTPLCGNGVNDDGMSPMSDDLVVDDGCPGGPPQQGAFSEAQFNIGTSSVARCGAGTVPSASASWPADFVSGGTPVSTDKVNILDLTSFLAPTRRLDTSPGNPNYSARWDLLPGKQFANWIGISDLTSLIASDSGFPPMFGGLKAFGGPVCTGS